jgi:mRNA-degrading endonuclease YafQ of YafQ-DinJ toxin-antitoxin module
MRIEEIYTDRKFEKQYKKLPERIRALAKQKEILFKENPFDQRLSTHKLHGKDKEIWSFYITPRTYRIKFIFLTPKSVLFLEIGTHDVYR